MIMKFPQDRKVMKKTLKKWPPKKPVEPDADDMPMRKKKVVKKKAIKKKGGPIKTSGKFGGKSNRLGQGGRAAQLRARGVPGGVIGNLARRAGAAPGGPNFHKAKAKK